MAHAVVGMGCRELQLTGALAARCALDTGTVGLHPHKEVRGFTSA